MEHFGRARNMRLYGLSRDELRACGVLDPQEVYGSDPSTGSRLARRLAAEARWAGQVFPGETFRVLTKPPSFGGRRRS